MSWPDFSRNPDYPASYIQATAAVFVRYLDQQGKLQPIYFAVRDHHLTADLSTYRSYSKILEDVFHAPIGTIQANFDAWFAEQYRVNSPAPVPSHGLGSSGPSQPVCKTPEDFADLQYHEAHPEAQTSAKCVRPMPPTHPLNPMKPLAHPPPVQVPSPSSDH